MQANVAKRLNLQRASSQALAFCPRATFFLQGKAHQPNYGRLLSGRSLAPTLEERLICYCNVPHVDMLTTGKHSDQKALRLVCVYVCVYV